MSATIGRQPCTLNLKLYRGDDLKFLFKLYRDADRTTLADMSTWHASLTIRDPETGTILDTLSDADNITLLDASGDHNMEITFTKTRTDSYAWSVGEYDLSFETDAGDTFTQFRGVILVSQDVR